MHIIHSIRTLHYHLPCSLEKLKMDGKYSWFIVNSGVMKPVENQRALPVQRVSGTEVALP